MEGFWEHLASQKPFKIRSLFFCCFLVNFGARRRVGGRWTERSRRYLQPKCPLERRPLFRKKGSYNDPCIALDCFLAFLALEAGLQGRFARDLTRPGPLSRQFLLTCLTLLINQTLRYEMNLPSRFKSIEKSLMQTFCFHLKEPRASF